MCHKNKLENSAKLGSQLSCTLPWPGFDEIEAYIDLDNDVINKCTKHKYCLTQEER